MILDTTVVTVFVLALARSSAWVSASPILGALGLPRTARLAVAMSLALFVAAQPVATPPPAELAGFITVLVGQVAVGLLLGWFSGIALAVFQGAGALIDVSSGYSVASLLDPTSGEANAIVGRIFSLLFLALLFATNAHLMVIGGFARSFDASPVGEFPLLGTDTIEGAGKMVSQLFLAAIEVAAPVLGALLLTEVALALAARFAPNANIFLIGLPLKAMVTLATVGMLLVYLPGQIETVIGQTLRESLRLVGA